MIRGIDSINKFLEINKCEYFQIRHSPDKDAYLFQSDIDEENIQDRKGRLNEALSLLQPGKYYLEGWTKEGQKRNWYRDWIMIEPSIPGPAVGSLQSSYPEPSYLGSIEARINEAIEKERLKMKVERLEENSKEQEEYIIELEEKGSAFERILTRVEPYIGTLLGAFVGNKQAVGIAGTDEPIRIPIEANAPESERIEIICSRLKQFDPNYLDLLELLCDRIDENPSLLSMIKNFAK